VFAVLWVAVKLDSRGPGLFSHRRLGLNGMGFPCLKFRSMHADADERLRADGPLYREYAANDFKLPAERDPRLTRVGRFLRRTSLDELPQLLNVLRGDMSLVGPRPIVPEELEKYGHGAALFLSLKPGITGAWAVNGRSEVAYPDRADLELEYVRAWSLLGDVGILLRTVPAVLLRRGAH
jgi:lipopolysaccharide/colanic/teichoic acid biosynthesis glycosyltransferase